MAFTISPPFVTIGWTRIKSGSRKVSRNALMAFNPKKDVDAFHPANVGKIMIGNYDFVPCTPAGVMELIAESGIDISGKECVIVGRSNIVGLPISKLLLDENATVTIAHSKTKNLKEICLQADIVIAALGRPEFVKEDMIKPGAVVIDVGTTRVPDASRASGYRLCGDVDYANVAEKCSFITPVPGGVGPMTICSLMKNTLLARKGEVFNS